MDKLDIILWVVAGGFSVIFTLLMFMWHSINSKFEKIDEKFEKQDEKFEKIEIRLAVVETTLSIVNNNVTHLMWQHQIPRESRDVQEQWPPTGCGQREVT